MRKTAFILVSVLAVSLFAVAAQAFHASSSKLPKQAGKQLVLADPQTTGKAGFGNHNLKGLYEFQADGVVEVNGVPTRGFWEVGKFEADGKGNISNGVEYSTLLSSSDEAVIDRNFTFSGTYTVNRDGTATGQVTVDVAPGVEITKKLWLIIHSVGKEGIANGFDGGHADADLGGGVRGNARSHVGHRIEIAK